MKCPKCDYIAFESGGRCKNCGYGFSLSVEAAESPGSPELPILKEEPLGPLADLSLSPDEPPRRRSRRRTTARAKKLLQSGAAPPTDTDLPLFLDEDLAGEEPLVRRSPTPRAPLAVRRSTPARVRTADTGRRTPQREESVSIELDDGVGDEPSADRTPGLPSALVVEHAGTHDAPVAASTDEALDLRPHATPTARLVAALIDFVMMAAIDLGVLYLTLRLLDLPFGEVLTLPKVPLIGFLALLNGGYFIAFTAAGGQTIGKMARHIRVVGRDGRVHLGQSIVRTVGYLLSALPVGLGFVAGALGPDGVALHDRLASTRVVRSDVQ